MGRLTITGLPEAVADRLKNRWRLKGGDVYDNSYFKEFLRNELSAALPQSRGAASKIATSEVPDRAAHTVDVGIDVR